MVEPRPLVGFGVRQILDRESDIDVIAQVGTPDEAIQALEEQAPEGQAPDVVLVNATPAESSESDATLRLRRETPDSAFVVLGGGDNDASLVGAIEMGAMGHVGEGAEPAELVATIRRVAHGEDALGDDLASRPDLVERILHDFRNAIFPEPGPPNPLTAREVEILGLVADGLRNREIADALEMSLQTVKNHLTSVMHKLGAPNRTRAVMSALRNEWLATSQGIDNEATQPSSR